MSRKKVFINLIIFFIIAAVFGLIFFSQHVTEQRQYEEQRRIQHAYARVNSAFIADALLNVLDEFMQIPIEYSINQFGIDANIYLRLLMYENRTGNTLSYETVVEFFSQEFEPDGSLRLYNNRNHPEIQQFVDWFLEESRRSEWRNFWGRLVFLTINYQDEHGFYIHLLYLPPQMLAALARGS